jgi:hypothetical protein
MEREMIRIASIVAALLFSSTAHAQFMPMQPMQPMQMQPMAPMQMQPLPPPPPIYQPPPPPMPQSTTCYRVGIYLNCTTR